MDGITQLANRLDALGAELEVAMHELNEIGDPNQRYTEHAKRTANVDTCRKAIESYGKVVADLLGAPLRMIHPEVKS